MIADDLRPQGYFEKKPHMLNLLEKLATRMKLTDAQKLRVIVDMEKSFCDFPETLIQNQ